MTAQVYTDLGLFTADQALVDDVTEVFNFLTGYSNKRSYNALLVAPVGLRQGFKALIDREIEHAQAGRPARIIIKNNAVADQGMIKALYRASQAGVKVDMIVRGVCCLRPGIPGVSDNISVRSIVGRFLEHSRIYYFLNGGDEEVYIGSADLMERNLDRRVEVICPIQDAGHQAAPARHGARGAAERHAPRLGAADRRQLPARAARRKASTPLNSQQFLLEWYSKNAALQD